VRLSDRLDAQNAQIVSDQVLWRRGWSDVVFALHDAQEEIGPRTLRTRCEANGLDRGRSLSFIKRHATACHHSKRFPKTKAPPDFSSRIGRIFTEGSKENEDRNFDLETLRYLRFLLLSLFSRVAADRLGDRTRVSLVGPDSFPSQLVGCRVRVL
jgi:hypothetical protein